MLLPQEPTRLRARFSKITPQQDMAALFIPAAPEITPSVTLFLSKTSLLNGTEVLFIAKQAHYPLIIQHSQAIRPQEAALLQTSAQEI